MSQANAIDLVINGVSYNISEYKIENNGQRIIINHNSFNPNILSQTSCEKRSNINRKDIFKEFNSFVNSIKRNIPNIKRIPASKESTNKESYQ